jgi:hypothetical protein
MKNKWCFVVATLYLVGSSTYGAESGTDTTDEEQNARLNSLSSQIAALNDQQQDEELGKLFTKNKFLTGFHIGVSFMPEYNDEGDNEGFQEANLFARLNLDSRQIFGVSRVLPRGEEPKKEDRYSSYHMGVNLDFYSANIVNCEKLTGEEQANCKQDKPDVKNLNFNDVANTVDANIYGWVQYKPRPWDFAEVGIGFKYGFLSREKLRTDGDSVNDYAGLGIRYSFYDFKDEWGDQAEGTYRNGVPRFFIEHFFTRVEDFAGLGIRQNRNITMAAFRIIQRKPAYFGIIVNGGKGPDSIAVTLSYGLSPESMLSMF